MEESFFKLLLDRPTPRRQWHWDQKRKEGGGKFQVGGNIEIANTESQQRRGLRGRTRSQMPAEMIFPNSTGPFDTIGMKSPIDIQKYDNSGRLIKSFKNVKPGRANIPMGNQLGTVIERPSGGGRNEK